MFIALSVLHAAPVWVIALITAYHAVGRILRRLDPLQLPSNTAASGTAIGAGTAMRLVIP